MSSTIESTPTGVDVPPGPPLEVQSQGIPMPRGIRLEIKRIDKSRDPKTRKWGIADRTELVRASDASDHNPEGKYAAYAEYAFLVRRKIVPRYDMDPLIKTVILVQSERLKRTVQTVMKDVDLDWDAQILKIDPQWLLAYLPRLKEYCNTLDSNDISANDDKKHLNFLIDFLESEYAETLRKVAKLLAHREITFDLLWAIFLPMSILMTTCHTSSEPRAFRLLDLSREHYTNGEPYWHFTYEYVDANKNFPNAGQEFQVVKSSFTIRQFEGSNKISAFSIYPIEWHSDPDEVKAKLVRRGYKWMSLSRIHHMQYKGLAYNGKSTPNGYDGGRKHYVNGRIMIDRRSHSSSEPYDLRRLQSLDSAQAANEFKVDHQAMLTPPILYGFSLMDKLWLDFNVENVEPIEWTDEAFKNIAICPDRKLLVQSLVESHSRNRTFDDFVQGKGLGLVINLFGPPGVGKTLTVEATSEHLRKPLYVVGAGHLGTTPSSLDSALTRIFSLSPLWGAVVLIDEADVFLEQRSAHDIERNAMVAVFLRQIEYFRGVLFLTTNRVQAFDQAFQSRIHLSLHYGNLTRVAREQLWRAFLQKIWNKDGGTQEPTVLEMRKLSKAQMNGRQIKNAIQLAVALADHENAELSFSHLARTLRVVEESTTKGLIHRAKEYFRLG